MGPRLPGCKQVSCGSPLLFLLLLYRSGTIAPKMSKLYLMSSMNDNSKIHITDGVRTSSSLFSSLWLFLHWSMARWHSKTVSTVCIVFPLAPVSVCLSCTGCACRWEFTNGLVYSILCSELSTILFLFLHFHIVCYPMYCSCINPNLPVIEQGTPAFAGCLYTRVFF